MVRIALETSRAGSPVSSPTLSHVSALRVGAICSSASTTAASCMRVLYLSCRTCTLSAMEVDWTRPVAAAAVGLAACAGPWIRSAALRRHRAWIAVEPAVIELPLAEAPETLRDRVARSAADLERLGFRRSRVGQVQHFSTVGSWTQAAFFNDA